MQLPAHLRDRESYDNTKFQLDDNYCILPMLYIENL